GSPAGRYDRRSWRFVTFLCPPRLRRRVSTKPCVADRAVRAGRPGREKPEDSPFLYPVSVNLPGTSYALQPVEARIDLPHQVSHMWLMHHDRIMRAGNINASRIPQGHLCPAEGGVRLDPIWLGAGAEDGDLSGIGPAFGIGKCSLIDQVRDVLVANSARQRQIQPGKRPGQEPRKGQTNPVPGTLP